MDGFRRRRASAIPNARSTLFPDAPDPMTDPTRASSSPFVVVIGDVVGSRELPDRAAAQERIRAAVASFNDRHGAVLAAPLDLTGGDEMKTILDDPSVVVDLVTELTEELHPLTLVWGVGRGPLDTSWTDDVGGLDGPCFYRARQAVQEASDEGVWARVHGFSDLDDQVLSALFRLAGAVRASWTEKQWRYVRSVRERSQKATAETFGVTAGAVSQSLGRARFRDVLEAEAVLRRLLAAYRAGAGSPRAPAAPAEKA